MREREDPTAQLERVKSKFEEERSRLRKKIQPMDNGRARHWNKIAYETQNTISSEEGRYGKTHNRGSPGSAVPYQAQNTDNLKQDFGKTFHNLMPLVVAITCLSMAEKLALSFLEQDAEKALGRPLTAYDRLLLTSNEK